MRHGFGQKKALHVIALVIDEILFLLLFFYAFADNRYVERMSE